MDQSDRATCHEEFRRDIAQRERKPVGPEFTGTCHNCEAPLEAPKRWCDKDCLTDWEARRK